ncbi:hypothetical protein [Pseudomonas syringae]|uniref:hypothetical protein n=1 Tax=Pseudomonas syringae TaxID=317 RepID=UPI00200A4681|nr:hypothetical protein [Pseudomonas syringae]MCK9743199.1 hypothetical protein [Pseudomonas syringae pv. syringae]
MTLERFQTFDFRIRAFVLRGDLGDIAINALMKGGALCLDARDKNASIDFAFDHACPGLGVGLGFEGFALGWIALTANLRFPLSSSNGWAATPDRCNFDHSRNT